MIPTKSMRISNETKAAFDLIAKEVGGNQDKAMQALLRAYESLTYGEVFPGSKTYLDDINKYLFGIDATVKALITAKETAEENARKYFQNELTVKDRTIADYQLAISELNDVRARAENAEARADKAEEALRGLEKQLDGFRAISASVAEMDTIRKQLADAKVELASVRSSLNSKDETIELLKGLIQAGGNPVKVSTQTEGNS